MRSEPELREAVRRAARDMGPERPDLAAVLRRGRTLRTRRTVGGGILVAVLAAAIAAPLWVLAPVGTPPPPSPPRPADRPPLEAPMEVFFPTLARPADAYPDEAIAGTIEERHGCLFLGGHLVLWPHGWRLEERDGRLTILDEEGTAVAAVGDGIQGGGGGVPDPERHIDEPIPDRCRGDGYLIQPRLEVVERGEA